MELCMSALVLQFETKEKDVRKREDFHRRDDDYQRRDEDYQRRGEDYHKREFGNGKLLELPLSSSSITAGSLPGSFDRRSRSRSPPRYREAPRPVVPRSISPEHRREDDFKRQSARGGGGGRGRVSREERGGRHSRSLSPRQRY